ncbi:MAG: HAD family hydrolase [Bacteroides sp.]|nr:HAD family hydrolase [Bacteroides sp.]
MIVVFDLDDTLYAEMDFVRSGYRAIANRYGHGLLAKMLHASTPREAFDSTGLPINDQLELYRSHYPAIRLPWQSLYTLASLKKRGHILGLVTDGRGLTQRNKINALGLDRFIDERMIFISGETGVEKVSGDSFGRIMLECGPMEKYMYVGDNPAKDFIPGNRLGWDTVCLLDGTHGENIFSQDFNLFPQENQPKKLISSLIELLDFDDLRKR